jgi:H+/Cl- antiporter ClcA
MSIEDWLLPSTTERIAKRVEHLTRTRSWIGLATIILAFIFGFIALFLFAVTTRTTIASHSSEDLRLQLKELDNVKESLGHLVVFIDQQAAHIKQEQEGITALSEQRSQLEPIVKSDRAAIEQLFALQERRTQQNRWKDLALGFVLGVFGSFTASVIFELVRRWMKRKLSVPIQ